MKIALVGSTRFKAEFEKLSRDLTFAGHLVWSLPMFGSFPTDETHEKPDAEVITEDQKALLDLIHMQKVALCEAIVIVDKDGYTGTSTKREILWARLHGLKVFVYSRSGKVMYNGCVEVHGFLVECEHYSKLLYAKGT